MIKVAWPIGCYGSYVMQSIFAYSNLGRGKIAIDENGSSHTFRDSKIAKKYSPEGWKAISKNPSSPPSL